MPLKHAILGLLNYAEMTGYDIDRYFKSSIAFFWHAQTSQIYKELNTCTKHNWVDSEIVYQSDKPNKKVFHIGKYPVPFFRGKPVLCGGRKKGRNGFVQGFLIMYRPGKCIIVPYDLSVLIQ